LGIIKVKKRFYEFMVQDSQIILFSDNGKKTTIKRLDYNGNEIEELSIKNPNSFMSRFLGISKNGNIVFHDVPNNKIILFNKTNVIKSFSLDNDNLAIMDLELDGDRLIG